MNYCEHDHRTRREVRRLPMNPPEYKLTSHLAVCHRHYKVEIAHRHRHGYGAWAFPAWGSLAVDQPGQMLDWLCDKWDALTRRLDAYRARP